MIIDDKIRDGKLQYDINREAAKISALSSGKIDKYEYLTDEEILPSDQSRMIAQVSLLIYPKPDVQELKIQDAIVRDQQNEEAKNEKEKIKEIENIVKRGDLIYETNKYVYSFQQFETIRSFAKKNFSDKITLNNADKN